MDIELSELTKLIAVVLGSFGIVFGLGATAFRGWQKGVCQMPPVAVHFVVLFSGSGMFFRGLTFVLDKHYWLFVAIDGAGFIFSLVIVLQHFFGWFLKKQEV